jgi:hypothetical protein
MRLHLLALLFVACGSAKTGGDTTPTMSTPLDLKLGVTATRDMKSWAIQQDEELARCDLVELHIDIEQPAYVYVVQFLPNGTPQVLFPATPTDQLMKPGTRIRIPEDGDDFQIVGEGGENVVYVLMSREPIDKVAAALGGSIRNIRKTTASGNQKLMKCEQVASTATKIGSGGTGDGGPTNEATPTTPPTGTPPGGHQGPRVASGNGVSRDKFLTQLKSRGDFIARQIKVIKRPNAGSVVHVTAKNASDTLLVADFTFKHTE